MTSATKIEQTLARAVQDLREEDRRFALVGGLAVSVRAEVRFTRDVDLAVAVADDTEAETLVHSLRSRGYTVTASVEHESQARLATIRLKSPIGVKVDLLFASSGIEQETVERATQVGLPLIGAVPTARPEELLALKILSMTDQRLQDRMDAQSLLRVNDEMDLSCVRDNLRLIAERGFARRQDLHAKLATLLATLLATTRELP